MRRTVRMLFRLLVSLVLILVGILLINTIRFTSRQPSVQPIAELQIPDSVFHRLAKAIQIPTVSNSEGIDTTQFLLLDSLLTSQFPLAMEALEPLPNTGLSSLFHWPGKNPKLSPILLIGHLDVMPVEPGTEANWTHPPFSGAVTDGFIWGRGSLDDKMSIWGILEAVELLLAADYSPNRSVYLAFGHDEELNGAQGAASMAETLAAKGLDFAYVLDEGLVVLEEALPGLDAPVGMIGLTEKGYASFRLSANLEQGGHSSMPPKYTAIGVIGEALHRLEENPFPARIEGPARAFFEFVGPELSFQNKLVMANLWCTESLVIKTLENDPASNALLRTTVAPTLMEGGVADNVLPTRASTTVNLRIRPGETVESCRNYIADLVRDLEVEVTLVDPANANDPPPASGMDSFGFEVIQQCLLQVFPDAVVAPNYSIARTDARHYQQISDHVFRFSPVQLEREDLKRIHGINERISLENYQRLIRFYHQLIQESCK